MTDSGFWREEGRDLKATFLRRKGEREREVEEYSDETVRPIKEVGREA